MSSVNNIEQPVTSAQNKIIYFLYFSFLSLKTMMKMPSKKPSTEIRSGQNHSFKWNCREERCCFFFFFFPKKWGQTPQAACFTVLQQKIYNFHEHWLKFTFREERLHGRYFQIKIGNTFIINQRININREDAKANKTCTRKLSTAMWMNEQTKQNQNHRRCLWILTSTCIRTVMVTVEELCL